MVRLLSIASLAVHAAAFEGEWTAQDEALSLLQHKVMGHHFDQQNKVTVGEEKGHELKRRATPDGASNIEFVDTGAGAFAEAGKLASVSFYVQRAGNKGLRFRIYRPSGGGYQYVGQTEEIEIPTANVIQEYTFSEQVPFLAGDYIGWMHTGNGNIPFDGSGTSVFWNYGPVGDGCGNVPSDGTQARTYSYMITTAPASAADYADAEMCGAEVPEGLADEGAAEGDPHLTYGSKKRDVDQSDVHHGREAQLIQRSKRGNVNCGFSADACKMECEKVGKTFGVATPRSNGSPGWPGVGDYAGVGCYTYTPRMARFLGQDTANSCVYGIMDSGKHPESDAELVSTHRAWAQFGPGTGARQLYVRLPNTFGNPNGVNHCEDLEEPTDPNPEDTENEEEAEQEAQQELENEDQASATGDPHLTTNTGEHFDLSLLEP